jgi:hypothetical protein
MKRIALSALAFLGVIGCVAIVAWLGGFNFDHRGPIVGEVSWYAMMFAGFFAYITWICNDE